MQYEGELWGPKVKRLILASIFALLVASVMGGCGETATESLTPAPTGSQGITTTSEFFASSAQAAATTSGGAATATRLGPAEFGDTVAVWGLEMTVDVPAIDSEPRFVSEGKELWAALVTIENTGTKERPYNLFYYSAQDSLGFEYAFSMGTRKQQLGSGDLAPGMMVKGHVAFEIAIGSEIASITFHPLVLREDVSVTWER